MSSLLDENENEISTTRLASGVSIEGSANNLETDLQTRDSSLQDAQVELLYNAAVTLQQCSVLNDKLELDKWL